MEKELTEQEYKKLESKYEKVFMDYVEAFDAPPPSMTTFDPVGEKFIEFMQEAIDRNEPITQDEFESKFLKGYDNPKLLF